MPVVRWRQGSMAPPVHRPIASAASSSARSFSFVNSARSFRSRSSCSSSNSQQQQQHQTCTSENTCMPDAGCFSSCTCPQPEAVPATAVFMLQRTTAAVLRQKSDTKYKVQQPLRCGIRYQAPPPRALRATVAWVMTSACSACQEHRRVHTAGGWARGVGAVAAAWA